MMKRDEIVSGLRRQRVETGSIACLGCGWENSCGARGCRIMREAADMLENDESQAVALQRELALRQAQLDCAAASSAALKKQNEQMRDAAAQVTKLAAEAAVERDWISVEDRLPGVWRNDETAELVNYMIYSPDFGVDIGNYHAMAKKWLCMGLPCTVTHWALLPEPPKEEN